MKARNIVIGAVVVVAVLVALGSQAGSPTASSAPSPTQAAGAIAPTDIATDVPATQAPQPKTLLTLAGQGIKNSKPFAASGDSVDVAYTFDCKSFGSSGNFMADLVGADGRNNSIANALAANGKDSTTLYLANTTSPYHVEVNSECSWSVTVTGAP